MLITAFFYQQSVSEAALSQLGENPAGQTNTSALWVQLTARFTYCMGLYSCVTRATREEKGVKRWGGDKGGDKERNVGKNEEPVFPK